MAKLINTVAIENFKSIKSLKIENCAQVNVIIGKPNVGKSSILEALSLLGNSSGDRFYSDVVHYEAMSNLFFNQEIQQRKIQISSDVWQSIVEYVVEKDFFIALW